MSALPSTDQNSAEGKDDPISSATSQKHDEDDQSIDQYPHGVAFLAIIGAVILSMFLVAIDNVSTVEPCCVL